MVRNYFIENVRYSRRVLEYSLRYSPSTRVANYSDSTALADTQRWACSNFCTDDRRQDVRRVRVSATSETTWTILTYPILA